MKALDTSVLALLLHGDRAARDLARKWRGVEIATTELNMLELYVLAARAPPRARAHRREAVERLRRSLTVLPFDSRAAERLGKRARKVESGGVPLVLQGILGILEAAGCDEFVSLETPQNLGKWPFRITKLAIGTIRH
jgi:predicted nucleic acid-binding protein